MLSCIMMLFKHLLNVVIDQKTSMTELPKKRSNLQMDHDDELKNENSA